jgi:hypothetical protein
MKTHMKKYLVLALALAVLAGASSCGKDPETTGTVELVFRALWDGQPLVMNQEVAYPGGLALRFAEMDFYLSNARLLTNGADAQPLRDLDLVLFTNANLDPASAAGGIAIRVEDIPAGTYPGLTLGIGLDPTRNATRPQDYPSTHPLGVAANRYWEAWGSYIFSKLQGLADTDGDGVFERPFAYHAGGNNLYRELNFNRNITVKGGETLRLEFDLEVKELLRLDNGGYWDIVAQSSAHNPDNPAMLVIMNNYAQSLYLR